MWIKDLSMMENENVLKQTQHYFYYWGTRVKILSVQETLSCQSSDVNSAYSAVGSAQNFVRWGLEGRSSEEVPGRGTVELWTLKNVTQTVDNHVLSSSL